MTKKEMVTIECPECSGKGFVLLDNGRKAQCLLCHTSGVVDKNKVLKWLVNLAGKVETHQAWHDDEDLTDTDIRVRKAWESGIATAKEMGIADEEIKKCKMKGIYLYETHYCGISKY